MFCTCIFGITLVRTDHSIKQPKVVHIIVFKKIIFCTACTVLYKFIPKSFYYRYCRESAFLKPIFIDCHR